LGIFRNLNCSKYENATMIYLPSSLSKHLTPALRVDLERIHGTEIL
jgi:hypothetical protein